MLKSELSLPEIGLIAATRGMLGAGIALLAADRMSGKRRKVVGRTLVAIGAITTVPLLIDVFAKRK